MNRDQELIQQYAGDDPQRREALTLTFTLIDKLQEAGASQSEALELVEHFLLSMARHVEAGATIEQAFTEIMGRPPRQATQTE